VAHFKATQRRALVVVGGARDRCPAVTLAVRDCDLLHVGATSLRVMETPCHTRGHVLFCVLAGAGGQAAPPRAHVDADVEAVFSGDTVFIGGVGAFFHGGAAEMERNLTGRLGGVPDAALLYCGHEYSHDNLRFAAWLEPENTEVLASFLLSGSRRSVRAPTVPGSLGCERRTNPYFRAADPGLHAAVAERLAWAAAHARRSLARRAWDAVRAGTGAGAGAVAGAGAGAGGASARLAPPAELYRDLQTVRARCVRVAFCALTPAQLLQTGAWQGFKMGGRSIAAARRRALALSELERRSNSGVGAV